MKTCKGECGRTLPTEAFGKYARSTDGLRPICKECRKSEYQNNRENALARAKQHYADNAESKKAYQSQYAKDNREAHNEKNRAWRLANLDKAKAVEKTWRDSNKDARRVSKANRRALEKEAGTLPKGTVEAMLRVYDYVCMKPDCEANEGLHLDHIVPLSKGGANAIFNLQFLCEHHNTSKGNRNSEDYRPYPRLVDTLCT